MSNEFSNIAKQAEANLNTFQAKTRDAPTEGLARDSGSAQGSVDFQDADYGDGSSATRQGKYFPALRPKDEGKDVDQQQSRQHNPPGQFANEALPKQGSMPPQGDILREGQVASETNVGRKPPGPGGSQYKGVDYYNPETVPDSIAAEGLVPPESVTEASKETEGYGR